MYWNAGRANEIGAMRAGQCLTSMGMPIPHPLAHDVNLRRGLQALEQMSQLGMEKNQMHSQLQNA